jgi:glycosyltransferase involved in cell wall biosynthesis
LVKEKKRKIGIIVHGLYPAILAGKEKQALQLANYLAKHNSVYLFVRYHKNHVTHNIPYELIQIKYPDLFIIRYIYVLILSIFKIYKYRNKLDHLIGFGTDIEATKALIAGKLFKIPFTVSVRGEVSYKKNSRIQKIFNAYLFSHCKNIHLQSHTLKDDFNAVYNNTNIVVIPNGIEIKNFDYLDFEDRRNQIIYVGRLIEQKHGNDKGIRYLIESLKWLDESIRCIIIGDGSEREKMMMLAKGKNVEFFGNINSESKLNEYLALSKVFVLPSLYEGMPNIILEAMSVGTPVIATQVGSIPELITHGETGFLVNPKDPRKIAEYTSKLFIEKKTWKQISLNCLHAVEKYSWDQIGTRFEQLFE